MQCIYCQKNIKNKKHYPNCPDRKALIDKLFTEELLISELENHSANHVAKKYSTHYLFKFNKLTASTIIDICKRKGVETRSISESNNLQSVKNKRISTNIKKYGVDNPSKSDCVKNKKLCKSQERYGVDNVFQSDEVKEKSRTTCIKKYGTPYFTQSEEFQKYRNFGSCSKPHVEVMRFLDENKIKYDSEVSIFGMYNHTMEKYYSPRVDICDEHNKIVIEIYGDRWHCNPKIYKPNDLITHLWRGECFVNDVWEFDKLRKQQIESFGYSVLILWESDIIKNGKKVLEVYKKKVLDHYETYKN